MPVKRRVVWGALLLAALALFGALFFDEVQTFWHGLLFEVQRWQNDYRRTISMLLRDLRSGQSWQGWWALVSAGFVYGVLHAVGPGHGKAVIGTFLLTQPGGYKSALWLSVGSALLQGLSAIVWVGGTLGVLQWLMRDALAQVVWAERLSHVLVMAAGGYLLWRAWRLPQGCCGCGHHHGHHHDHRHAHHGHSHAPHAGKRATLFAVGIRPCSGSIVALAVAGGWGMWGVGIAMTLAVSIGTAVTVLSLALLTVYGRERFARRLTDSAAQGRLWGRWLSAGGGVLLVLLGGVLLAGSLAQGDSGVLFLRQG